jgi:hypothetical protein
MIEVAWFVIRLTFWLALGFVIGAIFGPMLIVAAAIIVAAVIIKG